MVNNSDSGCFPGNSVVTLDGEKKYYEHLKVGDMAKIWNNGKFCYSEIWCKTHDKPDVKAEFYQIDTESKRLNISPRHFIVVQKDGQMIDKMAQDIKLGDILFVCDDDDKLKTEAVVHIEVVEKNGIFNVFTKAGRLLVNGVLCSCYAEVKPKVVHPILAPLRAMYDVTPKPLMEAVMIPNEEGKPYLFSAASAIRPLIPF